MRINNGYTFAYFFKVYVKLMLFFDNMLQCIKREMCLNGTLNYYHTYNNYGSSSLIIFISWRNRKQFQNYYNCTQPREDNWVAT